MPNLLISRTQLAVNANSRIAGAQVPLRSERVALFLALLALGHEQRTAVTQEAFACCLVEAGAKSAPNRKSMSDIVRAAQDSLSTVTQRVKSPLIAWPPRGATVGPWHLVDAEPYTWVLDASIKALMRVADRSKPFARSAARPMVSQFAAHETDSSLAAFAPAAAFIESEVDEAALPSITKKASATGLRATLDSLIEADFAFLRGDYVPAAESLQTIAKANTALSAEGRACVLLRYVRCAKRLGWQDKAQEALQKTLRIAQQQNCRDGAALVSEVLTLRARLAYEQDPTEASRTLWNDLLHRRDRLPRGSAQRQGRDEFDRSNLLALMARRRAQDLLGQEPPAAQRACSVAWTLAGESLYWAWADKDTFNLQNGIANAAYMLQRLRGVDAAWCEANLGCTIDEVLSWHTLALKMCRLFNVGDETAWDRIFVGELWLSRPPLEWTVPHEGLQSEGSDPSRLAYYVSTVDRADTVGDRRQLAYSLQLLWRFAQHAGATPSAAKAVRRIRELPAALRAQLVKEGYELP